VTEAAVQTEAPTAEAVTAATTQRQELLGNAAFRAAAMDPKSAEWSELQGLDRTIAASIDAKRAQEEAKAAPKQEDQRAAAEDQDDVDQADAAVFFKPPAEPRDYQLPLHAAKQSGLEVDLAIEAEMRSAFHAAGVDQALASSLYTAAISAAAKPMDAVAAEGQLIRTEQALRQAWKGTAYEANLALAAGEARRIFAALPESVTRGHSYDDWLRVSGIGNCKPLIEQLYARAKARKPEA
jgi:hypothetical protein